MKADIMFLVDSSNSIGAANFETMKTFMRNMSANIQIGPDKTQIGVVQFSTKSKEEFQLNKYFTQKEISDAIDRMSFIGQNTLTGKALTFVDEYFTHPKGARLGVKKFLILITDGEAQDDVREPARALREKDVIIISVGVYGAKRTQLEEISGDGSLVFHVEKFDHLKDIESKLLSQVCARYGKWPCYPSGLKDVSCWLYSGVNVGLSSGPWPLTGLWCYVWCYLCYIETPMTSKDIPDEQLCQLLWQQNNLALVTSNTFQEGCRILQ